MPERALAWRAPFTRSFFRNVDSSVEPSRSLPVGDGNGLIRTLKASPERSPRACRGAAHVSARTKQRQAAAHRTAAQRLEASSLHACFACRRGQSLWTWSAASSTKCSRYAFPPTQKKNTSAHTHRGAHIAHTHTQRRAHGTQHTHARTHTHTYYMLPGHT